MNALPGPAELAALLSAKLCHDLISPTSAIVSGMDLIEDPESASMRDEALAMVASSARRLGAALQFCRVAYGASSSASSFDANELRALAEGFFASQKAELDWAIGAESLEKPAARALLNLAQLIAQALPRGGTARLSDADGLSAAGEGPRAGLRGEVIAGLEGRPMEEGMPGHWVQAYYLHLIVTDAGGRLTHSSAEDRVEIAAHLPR